MKKTICDYCGDKIILNAVATPFEGSIKYYCCGWCAYLGWDDGKPRGKNEKNIHS